MKIVLFSAGGNIGQRTAPEALHRGHSESLEGVNAVEVYRTSAVAY